METKHHIRQNTYGGVLFLGTHRHGWVFPLVSLLLKTTRRYPQRGPGAARLARAAPVAPPSAGAGRPAATPVVDRLVCGGGMGG